MATVATAWPRGAPYPHQSTTAASGHPSIDVPVGSTSRRSSHPSTSAIGNNHEHMDRHIRQQQPTYEDRFYGHRDIAELCERVIFALFSCPLDSASTSASSTTSLDRPAPRLSEFVAYALHRTRLPTLVTHHALFLLKRLKSRFPAARGSSGHRLFISALMLASKVECDDTYSNKSWTIVGQGLFSLAEINQMERELFGYLGFRVNVQNEELQEFVEGLSQGRINAPPIQAPSPAMGSDELPRTPAPTHTPTPVVSLRRPLAVSPSSSSVDSQAAYSSPSMAAAYPSTSRIQPVPTTSAPRSRHHSASAFNTRASISGYPSLPSSVPMSASASDPSLNRGQQWAPMASAVPHHDVRSPAPPLPCGIRPAALTPPVSIQSYLVPSSPLDSYTSPLSRTASNDVYSYIPSPYGSQMSAASSSTTSPETPGSEFGSPVWVPNHRTLNGEGSDGDDESHDEKPPGTYEKEHRVFARQFQQKETHHGGQHQHHHQQQQLTHFREQTGSASSNDYTSKPPRYHQQYHSHQQQQAWQ